MKRRWIITVAICLLLLGGGCFAAFIPRIVPLSECSYVYRKYRKVEGIEVTFIKDFKINDTLALDVTVLKANDTNAWDVMAKDFSFVPLTPEQSQCVEDGVNLITTKLFPKMTPPPSGEYSNDLLAVSHLNHTMTVFHVTRECETLPILFHNYGDIIKQ